MSGTKPRYMIPMDVMAIKIKSTGRNNNTSCPSVLQTLENAWKCVENGLADLCCSDFLDFFEGILQQKIS